MASVLKSLSLLCVVGFVSACGSHGLFLGENPKNLDAQGAEGAKKQVQQKGKSEGQSADTSSINAPAGSIVVEKSISVSLPFAVKPAIYPEPPAVECELVVGSLLIDVKGQKGNSFVARVSYLAGVVPASDKKNACAEGELVEVIAGSGFQGLALTLNTDTTSFQLDLGSDDLADAGSTDAAHPGSGAKPGSTGKALALSPSVTCKADGTDCVIVLPEFPSPKSSCFLFGVRHNVRLFARSERSSFTGQIVAASGPVDTMYRKDECAVNEKILVNPAQIAHVLAKELVDIPLPKPEPIPQPCGLGQQKSLGCALRD